MTDNSLKEVPVEWKNVDYDKMYKGGVAKYDITGTADGMEAHCFVSMIEYNFLENYSFEEGETGWETHTYKDMDELYVEDKATDSLTGTKHYHFWSAAADSVEFELSQEVRELPAGNYKYSISIMGGDAGDAEIYAYVKINGEIVLKQEMQMTGYGNWDTGVIENISYNGSDTMEVGIYVKCSGAGNGAWGKIDDALLNSVSE